MVQVIKLEESVMSGIRLYDKRVKPSVSAKVGDQTVKTSTQLLMIDAGVGLAVSTL